MYGLTGTGSGRGPGICTNPDTGQLRNHIVYILPVHGKEEEMDGIGKKEDGTGNDENGMMVVPTLNRPDCGNRENTIYESSQVIPKKCHIYSPFCDHGNGQLFTCTKNTGDRIQGGKSVSLPGSKTGIMENLPVSYFSRGLFRKVREYPYQAIL